MENTHLLQQKEHSIINDGGELTGEQGGGYLTVNSAIDGVNYSFISSGNIESGTFTLYGLK